MIIEAKTPEEYISKIDKDRKPSFQKLREEILRNIPPGFEEVMSYGMIGYVVPHKIYPNGYHCNPALPLPFINIGMQKHFIGLYHSGIYADKSLYQWFTEEYKKKVGKKADMGKSCVRLKKMEDIPFALIGELVSKVSVKEWISLYESFIKQK